MTKRTKSGTDVVTDGISPSILSSDKKRLKTIKEADPKMVVETFWSPNSNGEDFMDEHVFPSVRAVVPTPGSDGDNFSKVFVLQRTDLYATKLWEWQKQRQGRVLLETTVQDLGHVVGVAHTAGPTTTTTGGSSSPLFVIFYHDRNDECVVQVRNAESPSTIFTPNAAGAGAAKANVTAAMYHGLTLPRGVVTVAPLPNNAGLVVCTLYDGIFVIRPDGKRETLVPFSDNLLDTCTLVNKKVAFRIIAGVLSRDASVFFFMEALCSTVWEYSFATGDIRGVAQLNSMGRSISPTGDGKLLIVENTTERIVLVDPQNGSVVEIANRNELRESMLVYLRQKKKNNMVLLEHTSIIGFPSAAHVADYGENEEDNNRMILVWYNHIFWVKIKRTSVPVVPRDTAMKTKVAR